MLDMAHTASPLDFHTSPGYGADSPQAQTSNLTSAIRKAKANNDLHSPSLLPLPTSTDVNVGRPVMGERHASNGLLGSSIHTNTGPRPISMKDRARRESNNTGSLAGGMSWGGASVGSWIRDDIMMGTSPAPFTSNSPSFHSSSYLPKMEAAFMKDFTCCGLILASLHDLLQHFEEIHANAPGARGSQPANGSASRLPLPSLSGQVLIESSNHTQTGFLSRSASAGSRQRSFGSANRSSLSIVQDATAPEDMDIDMDGITFDGLDTIEETPVPFSSQPNQFHHGQDPLPSLNVNLANTMQAHSVLRTSTPTTSALPQPFHLQNNPTVSSVNTPTLGTMSAQNTHSLTSPESSHPSTPAELDMDSLHFHSGMDMDVGTGLNVKFANGTPGLFAFDNNGTIDQPGKRLFSKQGAGLSQAQLQAALNHYQLGGDRSETSRMMREQPMVNSASIPQFAFPEEVKPFRCPVIGCEKAYKNQNGLKYHKQHGHQNQQLKENDDGTFSIVDPLTSIPYPGTVGMEKEKPYRCEVCGKRYKNLNGLKYHKAHAPHCNPELALQKLGLGGNLQNLQNANVAGAGMGGIDPAVF